ncbi:MAG: glycosyltransferase family 4 protein [Deltaproteobacteria bacterium]|nr:glycosyltransferase family 4 protein [Deltaproteobacteria bacterium]
MERWAYVANIRLPSERADAVQVLNQCQALIQTGVQVELLVAWRLFKSPQAGQMSDLGRAFGLTRLPRIRQIPCLDLSRLADRLPGPLSLAVFYLQHLSFLGLALIVLALTRPQVVYVREVALPFFGGRLLKRLGAKVVAELHNFPQSRAGVELNRLALRRVDGLVVISQGLARSFGQAGLSPKRTLVAPDAVSEMFFTSLGRPQSLRQDLGLPPEGPIILYAGGLYWAWKGVAGLIEAQAEMNERGWLVIVGGSPERRSRTDLEDLAGRLGLQRVIFCGWVVPARMPAYLQAADVLVLPNSAQTEISRCYTSPLKLFEYLASARPVVASDLPSLKEILIDGKNCLLARPDDPASLARTIGRVLDDPGLARSLARAGRETARAHTWAARALKIRSIL